MSERSLVRASLAISAAALGSVVVVLALVAGCGEGSSATSAARPDVHPDPFPVQPAPQTPTASGAVPTAGDPPPAPAQPGRQVPKTGNTKPNQADDVAFWRLIAETRNAADNDTGRQSELLKDRLTQLSPQAILEFARTRHRLDQRAYTWNLWGAASVIEDGCSDDCFRDFRGYLISLGRGPYERALSNPDSLASVAQDAETGDWENADDVAPDAYSSVTGGDFPLDDSDLSGRPRGRPFNQDGRAGLNRRYPRLAAHFRN